MNSQQSIDLGHKWVPPKSQSCEPPKMYKSVRGKLSLAVNTHLGMTATGAPNHPGPLGWLPPNSYEHQSKNTQPVVRRRREGGGEEFLSARVYVSQHPEGCVTSSRAYGT